MRQQFGPGPGGGIEPPLETGIADVDDKEANAGRTTTTLQTKDDWRPSADRQPGFDALRQLPRIDRQTRTAQ